MNLANFSSSGFQVTANNAVDYIAGTQAASAGMISANIQETSSLLRADLGQINSTLVNQTDKIANINTEGFAQLGESMSQGFSTLNAISGASLAVQAGGFAVVAKQLHGLRGDVNEMHEELAAQGKQLISLQQTTNAHLGSLVDFAARTLETQEKILETLVTSKTVEARQFIRQGWENLVNGYEDDAFERFQRSLEHDNTVYVAHAALAQIYEDRGDDEAAEDHYVRATRFSEKAGDDVHGFSFVNYAGFLERRDRYDEAVEQLDAAQQLDDIEEMTRGSWCLYHAELLAQAGSETAALSSVEESIDIDDSFFLASMASEKLQDVQPELSETLIEIDQQRRAKVLEQLKNIGERLQWLEDVSEGASEELRGRAAEFFEKSLTSTFDELPSLSRKIQSLENEVHASILKEVKQRVCDVSTQRDEIVEIFSSPPTRIKPEFPPFGTQMNLFLRVVAGVSLGLPFVGVLIFFFAEIYGGPYHFSELLIIYVIGVILALIPALVVGFVWNYDKRNEKYVNRCVSKAPEWFKWGESLTPKIEEFEEVKASCREIIRAAPLDSDNKNAAFAKLDRLSSPEMPVPPKWVKLARNESPKKAKSSAVPKMIMFIMSIKKGVIVEMARRDQGRTRIGVVLGIRVYSVGLSQKSVLTRVCK